MKKFRLFRLILALATAAAGIYMIYANISVSGYNLLTMDSSAGYRAATTYRWSVLIFALLLAADIAAAVFYRRSRQKNLPARPAARCAVRMTNFVKCADMHSRRGNKRFP